MTDKGDTGRFAGSRPQPIQIRRQASKQTFFKKARSAALYINPQPEASRIT
jgi:hypothetical protein